MLVRDFPERIAKSLWEAFATIEVNVAYRTAFVVITKYLLHLRASQESGHPLCRGFFWSHSGALPDPGSAARFRDYRIVLP